MSHAGFELRPVRRYAAPRYPTTCHEPEPAAAPERRVGPREVARWVVCALLLIGLVLGAIACGDRARLAVVPPRPDGGVSGDGGVGPDGGGPPPDGGRDDGGDILMGDISECTPADLYCQDNATLMTCENYYYEAVDCDTYCQETYGWQSGSVGCDATADEPCQCYDMLDGGIGMCTPDMVECVDSATVTTCDPATGSFVTTSCETWCVARYGAGTTSTGCDASDPDDPCGCVTE